MKTIHHYIDLETGNDISIHNITADISSLIQQSGIRDGFVTITSQHTTTAISVNEYEERLLDDIKTFLQKLIPAGERYLHNDIHLRDCPLDEPENAHSHLAAMLLGNSEVIAIKDGDLVLGQWQSVMLLELDGPRNRKVSIQLIG